MQGTKPMTWWFILRIESYSMDSLEFQAAVIKAVEDIGWIGNVLDFYTVRSECFIQARCIWPEFKQIREFVWLLQTLVSDIKIYSIYIVRDRRVREIRHVNSLEANCIDLTFPYPFNPASDTALTTAYELEKAVDSFTGHVAWCTISFKGKNRKKNQKQNHNYNDLDLDDAEMLHEYDPNILEGGEGF